MVIKERRRLKNNLIAKLTLYVIVYISLVNHFVDMNITAVKI